jgi:hypothetical protein
MKQTTKIKSSIPRKSTFPDINFIQTAPTSSGKTFLLKHLYGDRLTRDQAIKAKCADCMGYYIDGRTDCELSGCPLYPYMPYKAKDRG